VYKAQKLLLMELKRKLWKHLRIESLVYLLELKEQAKLEQILLSLLNFLYKVDLKCRLENLVSKLRL